MRTTFIMLISCLLLLVAGDRQTGDNSDNRQDSKQEIRRVLSDDFIKKAEKYCDQEIGNILSYALTRTGVAVSVHMDTEDVLPCQLIEYKDIERLLRPEIRNLIRNHV